MRIDINSDMGESFGAYKIGNDAGLMKSITSANIAAGFHGGDPSVLRETIRNIKSLWIKEQHARVVDGKISEYQVNMLVTFTLDD